MDTWDSTGTQVGVELFAGACPPSGTAIYGPVYATTDPSFDYTKNIPTSSLSLGSYCVYVWSTHTQVSVDDPLTVAAAPPIPEYPFGLSLLAILMIVGYAVVRRRTIRKQK